MVLGHAGGDEEEVRGVQVEDSIHGPEGTKIVHGLLNRCRRLTDLRANLGLLSRHQPQHKDKDKESQSNIFERNTRRNFHHLGDNKIHPHTVLDKGRRISLNQIV